MSDAQPVLSGSLSPFGQRSNRAAWLVPVGFAASILLHAAAAYAIVSQPEQVKRATQWVEMAVTQPPPPPPPPPPPQPEPPKPKTKVEPVKFEDIKPVEAPPPDAPPAPPTRRVVKIQGLNASSFASGSGTGIDVRAGTTVGTKATNETMGIDEAKQARSYASVTSPPKVKVRAQMEVPKEAKEAGVEGEVRVSLDIDPEGRVTTVRVLSDLGHGTGEACAAAWKKSRYTPGNQDGTPVSVTGVPQVCQVVVLQ